MSFIQKSCLENKLLIRLICDKTKDRNFFTMNTAYKMQNWMKAFNMSVGYKHRDAVFNVEEIQQNVK